jgi:hypothetical protein
MQTSATHEFTMDPNLLVSVIKAQAGTLSKALLEGVMNSIDAGATRVDITLTTDGFTVSDDGRGFADAEEIRLWFGRFGTPHVENDAIYGRFRMGRGQMMAFAATDWKSGEFRMQVDIDKRGLTYELDAAQPIVKGCLIAGKLNEPLSDWRLRDTLTELKMFVAYALKPVYVNGELYGEPAAGLKKTWTFEDDDAFYKVVPGAGELLCYNQGVYVEEMGIWNVGMGGIVVSKSALKLNFARNAVMQHECKVWERIAIRLNKVVMDKMMTAKSLTDGERKYLARRLSAARYDESIDWRKAKVLTDPTGKHFALSELRSYKTFVHIPTDTGLACAAHGTAQTFVVTDSLLTRFGCSSMEDWLDQMKSLSDDLIDPDYEVIDMKDVSSRGLGGSAEVLASALARRERAAHATLMFLNEQLGARLMAAGTVTQLREIRVGKHKHNSFIAWTDGTSYITANKKFFKRFERGMDGVVEWLLTLVHEYTHSTDDSESHDHGDVFYRSFHDSLTADPALSMGSLARAGLIEYLNQLTKNGLPKPKRLREQLRSFSKVSSST